jgi:DNA-binding NarL/FixJ family response regulator
VELARPITVVLADDTEDMRDLVKLVLEIDGRFDVVAEVGDGRSAVEAAERHRPDALVLDLGMPVMSGDRALPLIRAVSPGTVVVVYTAYSTADRNDELLATGAAAVVAKTARPADLADLVARLVADARRD